MMAEKHWPYLYVGTESSSSSPDMLYIHKHSMRESCYLIWPGCQMHCPCWTVMDSPAKERLVVDFMYSRWWIDSKWPLLLTCPHALPGSWQHINLPVYCMELPTFCKDCDSTGSGLPICEIEMKMSVTHCGFWCQIEGNNVHTVASGYHTKRMDSCKVLNLKDTTSTLNKQYYCDYL